MMRRPLFSHTRSARAAHPALDPGEPLMAGLVARWPLVSSGGASEFAGAVGHEPPLTLSSTPPAWFPSDVVGAALSANGDVSWAMIPSRPIFAFSTMSAAIWFRWTGSGTNRAIFSRWSSIGHSWILRASDGPGHPAFNISTSSGNFMAASSVNCNDGKWHHLVGTYDGASTRLYVDGLLHASTSSTGTLGTPNTDIYLFRYSGEPTNNDYFTGDLADARLYRRALSDAEVWRLWDPATRRSLGPTRRMFGRPTTLFASASLGGTTTAAATCAAGTLGSAALLGITAHQAHATLRRVTKSATFEPPAWGEFDNGLTVAGSGASLAQSADAAFSDVEAGEQEFGARVTLGEGDGSAFLELPIAESPRSHSRIMARVPALAGGAVEALAAMNGTGDTLASLRLEADANRLRLLLPGGVAISHTIAAGDWNRWRCVEVAIDHTAGTGTLFIDGVAIGTAAASGLAEAAVAAWRAGALYKDHASAGTLDLDAWAIGPNHMGPPIVRATRETLDDPARWLIVCNSAFDGSRDWADAYRWARRVPHANVLALALPTTETIDASQAAAFRAAVREYLDATGLSLQVAGVLLGPGVPGLVTTENPHAPRAMGDWLVGAIASTSPNPHHAASVSSLARPKVRDAGGVVLVARMDAASADDAIALLTRALTIEQDPVGGDDRRLFIDADAPDESLASAAERLDTWRASVDRMKLRLPMVASSDAEPWNSFEHDGFFWGWRSEAATDGSFIADSGDRVFAFALPGSSGASPLLRTTGGWARAAIDAGYASTATAASPIGGDAAPDAAVFFESLRRGWSLAEAWLVSCPKLGVGLTLVGDPLLRATFPLAGWDVYGPAASLEAVDFARPTFALRREERATTLPESARPAGGGPAVYVVRRVDDHGRSEAGLAVASIETHGGEIVSASPLAPAWPDYDGWPIGVSSGNARAHAIWDRPCRQRSVETVALESVDAGDEPTTVATFTPGAWESRVEASVTITSTPRRFRWRIVANTGAEVFTPWSAPVWRPAADAINLQVQES